MFQIAKLRVQDFIFMLAVSNDLCLFKTTTMHLKINVVIYLV